jgi:cytochrome c peroxidase
MLSREPHYPPLFRAAFANDEITETRIARALAQFIRSLVSYQSRYDEGLADARAADNDFANFSPQENRGKALFRRNCAICHLPNQQDAHFVMTAPANTGLDEDATHTDGGVGDVTLNPRDLGLFKSPSLRNVEVTAPYMHDGRLATLEAVIDHYSRGGQAHPNRDERMQPLGFTSSERAALVAFLKTLTDRHFLSDPKFSDPFQ